MSDASKNRIELEFRRQREADATELFRIATAGLPGGEVGDMLRRTMANLIPGVVREYAVEAAAAGVPRLRPL